jgi:hemolysin activation/secretion protein
VNAAAAPHARIALAVLAVLTALTAIAAAPALAQGAVQSAGTVAPPRDAPDGPRARAGATPDRLRSLARGGYVVYFRHGHTHWQEKVLEQAMQAEGRPIIGNCAAQRNLDDEGRDDARRIRAALDALRVPVAEVLGSLYCRPSEYVRLITGKPVRQVDWLTGLSTQPSMVELKRRVSTPPPPGTNIVLGGHGERPFDLTGLVISEGDALVFDPRNHRADDPGHFRPIAWIKPAEWPRLAQAALTAPPAITGFTFATEPPDRAAALGPFIGRPGGLDTRTEAALALEHSLRRAGRALWRAEIAVDAGGQARVELRERTLESVTVNAGPHHDQVRLRASLPALSTGAAFDGNAFKRQLQLARENPARHTTVLFDDASGRVVAQVSAAAVKPWNAFAGVTNLASAGSGRTRLLLGGGHANLWDRDHHIQVLAAVGESGEPARGNLGALYVLPVPAAGGALHFTATRAHDAGGLQADLAPVTGSGSFAGLRWGQHLTPVSEYQHRVDATLDDRHWTAPGVAPLRTRALGLRYAAHWEEQWVGWKFGVGLAASLPGGRHAGDADFATQRADRRWTAVKLDAEWMRILTYDWRLLLRARGQLSGDALAAGERFALGGGLAPWGSAFGVRAATPWLEGRGVRGLPERAHVGDSGLVTSVEVWSWRFGGADLRAGAFIDAGVVRRNNALPGTPARDAAASIGLGLHFQRRGNVALALSFAHVLAGGGAVQDNAQRLDATLIASY